MTRPAIGFYWTLPVPWAGFRDLATDLGQAAGQSRTIRYQIEAVRRHAKAHGFHLIREEVFIEIAPDRVGEQMRQSLDNLRKMMQETGASLLIVDFADVQGWRRNVHLDSIRDDTGLAVEIVPPDEMLIDGQVFDPAAHFAAWRDRQRDWTDGKTDRQAQALRRARHLQDAGFSLARIAAQLNQERLVSASGKPWTADNLRKRLKAGK